ncbi:MAG: arsenate reductase [Woeseiaceae bacterium]
MLTMYGIPNCDSCRKARKWLEASAVEYRFHDLRADGLTSADIERWLQFVPREKLLNSRSTTWRALPESERCELDVVKVRSLLLDHPTLIKRPVLENDEHVLVGFVPDQYKELLG